MFALKGLCKWFDATKGFGFITVNEIDYFVHFKEIKMAGYKTLEAGQQVTFMAFKTERGWMAKDVILIKDGVASDNWG